MKYQSVATGVALAAAAFAANATSSLTLVTTNQSFFGSTGFFRPVAVAGNFNASAQDQIGWTTGGDAVWGPLVADSTTSSASTTGATVATANGVHAEAIKSTMGLPGSLTVSTASHGGFATAEQDFVITFWLGSHATLTFSWDTTLSGSQSGHSAGELSVLGTVSLGDQTATYPFNQPFAGTEGSGWAFASSPEHRSITFTNTSDSMVVTSFHSNVKISTRDVAAAVPEADAAWLAMAGMAMVGALIRRRRQG